MKYFFLGLLAFALIAGLNAVDPVANPKDHHDIIKNKTISELASEFVKETKKVGHEMARFFKDAISGHPRTRRSTDEPEYGIEDLLQDIEAMANPDRQGRADESATNDSSAKAEVKSEDADTKSGAYPPPPPPPPQPQQNYQDTYGPPPPSTYAPPPTTQTYTTPFPLASYGTTTQKPGPAAPILIPIPGAPGPPGPPGLPGLPGLPGKTPSLRGLKLILLTKIGKLWALAKAVALLCLLKFGGLLGLILGLVLPLYGKLKKAGIALPIHEPVYESASYGDSSGSFAPYTESYMQPIQEQAYAGISHGKATYETPAPYPAQGRYRK